jgi:hypothetical protein
MALFTLNQKQREALSLISGLATHVLLRGGARSSKTFTILFAIIARAKIAPGSRHAVLGFRQNRIVQAIVLDTFPKVLKLCYPNLTPHFDKQKCYYTFANGSEVWLGGLDDAERSEKVLGNEYVTIFLNECSQISYDTYQTVKTRLAQKVMIQVNDDVTGEPLPPREMRPKFLCDENPPKKSHWSYKMFIKKVEPGSGKPLARPDDYAELQMNPKDNQENLSQGYLASLDSLSAAKRRRFRDGEFQDANPNQLFIEDDIEKWRVTNLDELPDFVKVVVAVDPSGAAGIEGETNDAIGIVVAGLGTDGNAYILEDRTVRASPSVWGKVAVNAYHEHEADIIVYERNFGGDMCRHVLRTAGSLVPLKSVVATRGKVVRAQPIAALYEQGKIRHVGYLRELEDELTGFTSAGYEGEGSPNRADACVWACYSLFPKLTRPKEEPSTYEPELIFDDGVGY